jgi:pyrroloquinoline quinone biosynthesis protein D
MTPKLIAAAKFSWDEARGRWILQAPERVFFPDETAARIISLCDGHRTLGGIVDQLAREFDAPADEIRADAADLLQELIAEGVIIDDEHAR